MVPRSDSVDYRRFLPWSGKTGHTLPASTGLSAAPLRSPCSAPRAANIGPRTCRGDVPVDENQIVCHLCAGFDRLSRRISARPAPRAANLGPRACRGDVPVKGTSPPKKTKSFAICVPASTGSAAGSASLVPRACRGDVPVEGTSMLVEGTCMPMGRACRWDVPVDDNLISFPSVCRLRQAQLPVPPPSLPMPPISVPMPVEGTCLSREQARR